ncbi:unnamed protein product [Rotaria sordida]|uniref:Uncharacterized protein n=1 Tax=Rotaria sordida TaxID=392033 RepID=A0A819L2Q7_9BILA|nr:unnamed protein product [Rotaria sordida]
MVQVDGLTVLVSGGYFFDGSLITSLNEDEIRSLVRQALASDIHSFCVCGVFSPCRPDQEQRVAQIIREESSDVFITLSHEIAGLGLIERENVSILNACLRPLALRTMRALEQALSPGIPVFLTQNNGTLLSIDQCIRFPVLTFASGPTNSMVGAAHLTGGGTIVHVDEETRSICFGPDSVGYQLVTHALAFGGQTITGTDVALAAKLTSRMIRPPHFAVCNAVGATLCRVSATIESIVDLVPSSIDNGVQRKHEIDRLTLLVQQQCEQNGAHPNTVHLVDIEQVPLAYYPGGYKHRVLLTAIGQLDLSKLKGHHQQCGGQQILPEFPVRKPQLSKPLKYTSMVNKQPIFDDNGYWIIGPIDIEYIAYGAGILVAASKQIPCVDCDNMGRAFPRLDQKLLFIRGQNVTPTCMCDVLGRTVLYTQETIRNAQELEETLRKECTKMGLRGGLCLPPLTGDQVQKYTVHHSLSLAWFLGKAKFSNHNNAIQAVAQAGHGRIVVSDGKVVSVERNTGAGFVRGHVIIDVEGRMLTIDFQNENLMARFEDKVIASVPDLITLVEQDSGEPLSTETVKYGCRISVLVLPAPEAMTTQEALKYVGPSAFGYNHDYIPPSYYVPVKSVWDVYYNKPSISHNTSVVNDNIN